MGHNPYSKRITRQWKSVHLFSNLSLKSNGMSDFHPQPIVDKSKLGSGVGWVGEGVESECVMMTEKELLATLPHNKQ